LNKFIINEKATLIKNILIENNTILASDENYITKELFLEKMNCNKKSFLDTHLNLKTSDIIKFIPMESKCAIQVFFQMKKTSKTYFEFNSLTEYTEVKEFLISKTNFTLKEKLQSSLTSWLKKAAYSLLSIIIFGIIYFMAKDIENGNNIDIGGGRRKGLKKLMLILAESLGSMNTLIVAVIVVSGLCFWTYKAYIKGKIAIESYS
jgi:hypothetical protein